MIIAHLTEIGLALHFVVIGGLIGLIIAKIIDKIRKK